MKVCVFGAGAIGGHMAARLAKGGAEVSVIARGAHLAAIRANGLTVETLKDGVLHCHPRASENPADLGPQDAVLVTVKTPALPGVADSIAPLLGPETPVAFVMNGIPWWYFDGIGGTPPGLDLAMLDPGGALRAAIGVRRTLGGTVYSAASVPAPGVIHSEAPDSRLVLGELDGTLSPRVTALAQLVSAGGISGEATADIRAAMWQKLLGNLLTGLVCTLGRAAMKDVLAVPALREAAVRCGQEVAALAAAYGTDLGGAIEARVARSLTLDHKPSILQDLEAGRRMEVETLWLAPLRLARAKGVPTPTLDLLIGLGTQAARAAGCYDGKETP